MQKLDEMEIYINFKAMRLASLATNSILIIWSFYDYLTLGKVGLPLMLIFIHGIIYFGTVLFLARKVNKDE